MTRIICLYILHQTESVPIATYNQLLDANQCTMSAVRDKARAAADQMNAAAKNAEQAIRCVIHMLPQRVCTCKKVLFFMQYVSMQEE